MPAYRVYGFGFRTDYHFQSPLLREDREPLGSFALVPSLDNQAPQGIPDYTGQVSSESGEPQLRVWRTPAAFWLQFSQIGLFRVTGLDIEACPEAGVDASLLEIPLLSTVLALVVERRRRIMLHAAGAAIDGRVIGLVGGSRCGKSTFLAALLSAGVPLVTDDLLPLSADGDCAVAESGYPQIRLWPETARHFTGRDDYPYVAHYYPKCRVAVGEGRFGLMSRGPLPVAALFLLERSDHDPSGPPQVEHIPRSEAAIELLRHSFLSRLADLVSSRQERFERLCDIAELTPMFRVRYPTGLERLPDVVQAVCDTASAS